MQSIVALPALVAAAPVALVECDLLDGSVRSWNPAAEALFKRSAESVLGRECPLFDAIEHDHAGELLRQDVRSALPFRDRELTVQRPDGSSVEIRLSSAPVLDEAGETVSVALVAVDITAQHRHLRELRHFANHDPLTDLQNRRSFERALARIVGRARRGGPSGVLFVIDLDLLKQVNDRLGHLAGDALLIAVANVLRGTMRPRDLVARLGGDEFGVVVEGVTAGEARAIADRVRTSIGRQRIGPEGAGHSTASIGGIVIDGTRSPAELLAAADEALYVAKRRRDSAEIHLEAATGPKVETNGAAARLRRALSVDGISVQYQPVIDLRSGILHSQEALARVRLDREFHIASEFIELARAAGLIGEIDRRVVMLVLRHLAEPTQTPLSLNLSGGSLGDRRPA